MESNDTKSVAGDPQKSSRTPAEEPTESGLAWYDFVDIGSFGGSSIDFAMRTLGGKRGLGVEVNATHVERMRQRGYDCLQGDITKMTLPPDSVRFVVMSHVLEHMALHAVYKTIECAQRIATDFIYIRGPYFDADAFLRRHSLKFFWSDWHGHTCHLTTSLLRSVLTRLQLSEFTVLGRTPVDNSLDDSIHPLDSPPDQHAYSPEEHPPKRSIRFAPSLYREMICLVRLRDLPDWHDILRVHRDCETIGGTLPV